MLGALEFINNSNITYLTNEMKNTLVTGVTELKEDLAMQAYNYFMTNDFEPTTATIKIMREVVEIALDKGVLRV